MYYFSATTVSVVFFGCFSCEMNKDLCDGFSVTHYPILLWGPPIKFAAGKWDLKQDNTEIQSIDDGRTAERLLGWINERIGSSFKLEDDKYENEDAFPRNVSDPEQIARAIYDVEEATANAFDIIVEHKMINSDTRAPLVKFFQILTTHHPSKRCRKGTAELFVNFDGLWHSDLSSMEEAGIPHDGEALKGFRICGTEVPRGYWLWPLGSVTLPVCESWRWREPFCFHIHMRLHPPFFHL